MRSILVNYLCKGLRVGVAHGCQELYFLLDKCVYENDYVQLTICGKVG